MNLTKQEAIRELHILKQLSGASILNILFHQSLTQNVLTLSNVMERTFVDLHQSFLQKSLLYIILILIESIQCSLVSGNDVISIDNTLIKCFAVLLNSILTKSIPFSTTLLKEAAVFSNTHRVILLYFIEKDVCFVHI